MAEIHNSDLSKEIIDKAKLQLSFDKLPTQLAEKVVPTLEVNPDISRRRKIIRINSYDAGNDKYWYVPAGKRWRIIWGNVRVSTDANVANRILNFYAQEPLSSKEIWYALGLTQVASKTVHYNFHSGFGSITEDSAGAQYVPIPENFVLFEGDFLNIFVNNEEAGDSMRVTFMIEETDMLINEFELRVGADA